jgi:tRNA(Ile2) C34 agmatinyltransferase TiaS
MATWAGPYNCTDCGKSMDSAGTCSECLTASQKADEAIRRDLSKSKGKRK